MKNLIFILFIAFVVQSCNSKTSDLPVCTEFTPECELQKKWSAINIISSDSSSYDGFGNPIRVGWYLYNSRSNQVFPLSVISYSGTTTGMGNVAPAHNLGEDAAGSMTQLKTWGIEWKKEKLKTNLITMPGLTPQEIEVLCLSGAEISFLQFTGNEVAGRWKTY